EMSRHADRDVGDLPWTALRLSQEIEYGRKRNFGNKLVLVRERNFRMAAELLQPFAVSLLGGLQFRIDRKISIAGRFRRRRCDQEHLAVIHRKIGFPLGIGKQWFAGFERRLECGKTLDKIRIARLEGLQGRRRLCPSPCSITKEMDNRIAALDIEVELVQRFRPGRYEILLDVHRDVWALKLAPQYVTIAAKFLADG